jgi:hypothetical protein
MITIYKTHCTALDMQVSQTSNRMEEEYMYKPVMRPGEPLTIAKGGTCVNGAKTVLS